MTTVKNIRAGLRRYTPNTELVIAWWDKAWFETMLNTTLTDDEWQEIQAEADKIMEYCDLGDQLHHAAVQVIDAMRKQTA